MESAEAIARYTIDADKSARSWDGMRYTEAESSQFDATAAKWWGILSATSEMLRRQDGSASPAQLDYLSRLLFGGMGSFIDFRINGTDGETAKTNARLEQLAGALHSCLETERGSSTSSR